MNKRDMELSIVIPVHDEEDNVVRLFPAIEEAVAPLGVPYEVIFVDDASKDATWERLEGLTPTSAELVTIALRRNAGQTAAMACGFAHTRGRVVVTMDGDLQNDPADIPAMLEKVNEGYDLVCGWRKDRQDKLWTRKVPSKIANWLIRKITGDKVHDYGCSLKAYTRPLVLRMRLYNDMHRFLPFISQKVGARVGEMVVRHHARRFGRTKYGMNRTWKILVDLLSLKVLIHHHHSLLRWFVLMSLPLAAIATVLIVGAFRAPAEFTQVLLGSGIVCGCLAIFTAFLGFLSDSAIDAAQFDDLLVIEPRAGGMAR